MVAKARTSAIFNNYNSCNSKKKAHAVEINGHNNYHMKFGEGILSTPQTMLVHCPSINN